MIATFSEYVGSEKKINVLTWYMFFFIHALFFWYDCCGIWCCVAEQPGVIQVVPSQTYHLHKPVGAGFKLT